MKFGALAVLIGASVASQAQLYSQAPHTPGAAGGNGLSSFAGGLPTPPPMYDRQVADDFTVTGAGWSINRVTSNWVQATVGDANPVTQMNIAFYNSVAGSVGSLVATATSGAIVRSTGPGTYFGRPEQILDQAITPVVLGPGNYFVMIQANVNHNWFWLTSSPTTPIAGSPAQYRVGPLNTAGNDTTWPTSWIPTGTGSIFTAASDQAFALYGTPVPEPATMLAFAFGGVALLAARRRNRK